MNKKRIISILLVVIMLFNSLLPVVKVNAASNNVFGFNQQLYKAIKSSLKDHSIYFKADDVARTIEISDSELAKVTELILNEGGIYDLTNLDSFKYLNYLDVSGNNLTDESNLEVLNNLTSLNYLDLSSNKLLDVSTINDLILKIQNENGTVLLSNQVATITYDAIVDIEEDSNNEYTAKYELPKILEKAGVIKSVWRNAEYTLENGQKITGAGFIESMSNPVTADNNFIEVKISSEKGYVSGLAKLEIYIYDDKTEAASASNINPAATNILNGSRFTIYVTVHDSESEAIYLPDTNLYKAVKEQLTGGQTVNPNLESYPYMVDENGEDLYEDYFYVKSQIQNGIYFLEPVKSHLSSAAEYYDEWREDDVGIPIPYVYDSNTNAIYEIDYSATVPRGTVSDDSSCIIVDMYDEYYLNYEATYKAYFYTTRFEKIDMDIKDEGWGIIYNYEGYRVYTNGESRNLYRSAYDEAKILVIDNNDLFNKITNLILNNKEIRDLTGLEKFVGLESEINVSHNYLSDIEPIYKLQDNKNIFEAKLQEKYNYYLSTRSYGNLTESLNSTKTAKSAADSEIENIKKAREEIIQKFKEALEINKYTEKEIIKTNEDGTTETTIEKTSNENYENEIKAKAEEINAIMRNVYGYNDADDKHVYGYLENLSSDLNSTVTNLNDVYSYLSLLYNVYNNEYKLTTLLTPELNYQTLEEYQTYQATLNSTTENVKALFANELTRLVTLSGNQAISTFEQNALSVALGINNIPEYLANIPNTPGTRLTWVEKVEKIREVALYSEMVNYCLIKRMETNCADLESICEVYDDGFMIIAMPNNQDYYYAKEYLVNRINEFSIEGIDTSMEEEILNKLENLGTYSEDDDALFDLFIEYVYATHYEYGDYENGRYVGLPACFGRYVKLQNLVYDETYLSLSDIATKIEVEEDNENLVALYNAIENTRIINTITIQEAIDNGETYIGDLNLYKEAVALASKFVTNASEVSRYITLSRLKKLDISYNAYLDGIERISELAGLKELYAASDYLTDISEVDWKAMKYLRKLDLSYNFLTTIKPLEELTEIAELNVSNNLLSGALEFNLTNSQKTLKEFDLSGNQLEDITDIMNFLDAWSNGNDGNYIAREDTININLNNQTININVEDPIDLLVNSHTVDIELPKIFTQLKAIDVNRTSFGTESLYGRIESEGRYVTLLTDTVGNKEGIVKVETISGYDTCVGNGTKAIIKYTVVSNNPVVNSVEIKTEHTMENITAGDSITFTADVTGENLKDTSVTWSIEGNTSENTTISEDGVLVIAEDETAEKITVIAKSNYDATVLDQLEIVLKSETPVNPDDTTNPVDPDDTTDPVDPDDTTNPVDPDDTTTDPVNPGDTTDPVNPDDTTNPVNPDDTTNPVDPDDTADPVKPGVDLELGYTQEDEYLLDVAPKTPVEDFKTIFLNGQNYEVVIKKDGEEITSGILKTGMYVHLLDEDGDPVKDTNGNIYAYEIIVKGDVNGDGYANALDSLLIKSHRAEVETLQGEAFAAADINNDGKVNITDAKLLLYHRAEVKGYDLNFSK